MSESIAAGIAAGVSVAVIMIVLIVAAPPVITAGHALHDYAVDNQDTIEHTVYQICQLDDALFDALYEVVDDPASKSTLENIRDGMYVTELAMYALYWNMPENARHLWYDISCSVITVR